MDQKEKRAAGEGSGQMLTELDTRGANNQLPRRGAVRRLIDTIVLPIEAFKSVNKRPTCLAPIIVAIVAMITGNALYYWRVNPDWEQRVRARIEQHRVTTGETMTPEQVQKQISFAKTVGKFFIVLPIVSVPAFCLIVAGFYLIAFGMVFLRAPPYKKLLSVVAWSAAANRAVATLILTAVLLIVDKDKLQALDPTRSSLVLANAAIFLPVNTPAAVKSIASSVDVFAIWFLILLTIGFADTKEAKSEHFTVWKSGAVVFGLWVGWVLIKAGLALGFGY
jgi:hypothetical protein